MFFIGNLGAETLVGNYFSPQPNPFMHLWSLSAEWQIYIFAPISIVLLKKLFPIKFTLALLLISALNLLIQILFELSINSYYSSFSRIWEFYFGVLTAIYLRKFSLSINSFQLLVIRLIGILSLMIIISPFEIRVIFSQFLGVIFFISFLISSPLIYTRINIVLLWLGDRSYSIYLYHFPLIYLSLQSPVSPSTFSFRVLGTAVSLISTLIIANWSYTKIEIPSIRNRK
jgi:peptidoglycan/LPS O-acetylase OafA/YrhL